MSRSSGAVVTALALFTGMMLTGCAASAPPADDPTSIFDEGLTGGDDTSAPDATADATETAEADPADLSDVDACALLPKAEAEAMAQVTFMEPQNFRDASQPSCQYDTDPYGDQPTGQASIGVGPGAKKFYDIDVELGHAFEDIPGIGDEAHFEDNAIFVRKGEIWFSLTILRLDDPALYKAGIIAAATTVAGRI